MSGHRAELPSGLGERWVVCKLGSVCIRRLGSFTTPFKFFDGKVQIMQPKFYIKILSGTRKTMEFPFHMVRIISNIIHRYRYIRAATDTLTLVSSRISFVRLQINNFLGDFS